MEQKSKTQSTKYKIMEKLLKSNKRSRVNLAKKLEISKAAVADNVNKLLEAGIILETGQGKASKVGGRKPIFLEINKAFCYIVSVDLSFENPVCAIGNLHYELLHDITLSVPAGAKEEKRLEAVGKAIDELLSKISISRERVGYIIISSPGVVGEDEILHFSSPQFSRWTGMNIKAYLKERYQVPVVVKNDVNMALLAEMEMGKGKGYGNLAYITCGLGIGSGIALDYKLYEGENFAAGEIGYFIDRSSLESGMNLEEEIHIGSILAEIEKDLKAGKDSVLQNIGGPLEFSHLVEGYHQGDRYLKDVFYEIGIKLGVAVANMVSLLDLRMVIFGGLYSEFHEDLLKGVERVVSKVEIINPVIETSLFRSKGSIYGSFIVGTEYVIRQCSE